MPEIATVERVRDKLREFDERVDGAIAAAKALIRVKADAEKVLAEVQSISSKGEQSLQKAEAVRIQFQQLQSDWESLKQQVGKSQTESKETRDLLLSELETAVKSLATKTTEAEDRIKATNRASLAEQADLLRKLDASTRANADISASAQTAVAQTAGQLDGLLTTIREELQNEVRTKLTSAEELLESELQRIEKYLEGEQTTLRESVERQIAAFQTEVKNNLAERQQDIDRKLTDFLNKQNAMVQNLSQQIDSFNRVSQTQAADLAATNKKLDELIATFSAFKTSSDGELATQRASVAGLDSALQETTVLLNQTLEKLKHIPLIGSKFK